MIRRWTGKSLQRCFRTISEFWKLRMEKRHWRCLSSMVRAYHWCCWILWCRSWMASRSLRLWQESTGWMISRSLWFPVKNLRIIYAGHMRWGSQIISDVHLTRKSYIKECLIPLSFMQNRGDWFLLLLTRFMRKRRITGWWSES